MTKRITKKEDAGLTYGTTGKEDQLRGIEERSTKPGLQGQIASLSLEPALGQSMQRRRRRSNLGPILYCLATIHPLQRTTDNDR